MILWLILALMTAAALGAVVWPLVRARGMTAAGSDLAVYRDQFGELDREVARGLLPQAEAASARLEIQANRTAAIIQPHSISVNLPIGVPGGIGPSIWMTPRAAAMAALMPSRCHAASIMAPRRETRYDPSLMRLGVRPDGDRAIAGSRA